MQDIAKNLERTNRKIPECCVFFFYSVQTLSWKQYHIYNASKRCWGEAYGVSSL